MKVAIIGSGVSGLVAARALDQQHEVTVFEKNSRAGGHVCTVDVDAYGRTISVDVGFMIFNHRTYPNFSRMLRDLDVEASPTRMDFSVSLEDADFEWATGNLNMMLAQRANLFRVSYYRLLFEILRFFRVAKRDLSAGSVGDVSLRQYLANHGLSAVVAQRLLIPMGASIWSAPAEELLEYPAETLLGFFDDHGLLSLSHPTWLTIIGGSLTYVSKIVTKLRNPIRMGQAIVTVSRSQEGVVVTDTHGEAMAFDQLIFACHPHDALRLLATPSQGERELLGAFKYARNLTVLHGDSTFMPKRRRAWASWNYLGQRSLDAPVAVTYWINRIQKIDHRYPLFVTLNPPHTPRQDLVFASFDFEHPQFDKSAVDAQQRLNEIQGKASIWYCGAYTGYGFHEDGVVSALEIAARLGSQREPIGPPRIFRQGEVG